MYNNNEFKARLVALGKRQTDLFNELNKRGFDIRSIQQLNQFINKYISGPKAETVLCESIRIVNEWEKEVKR